MMMISEVHAAQQLSGFCVTMMILIIIIILRMWGYSFVIFGQYEERYSTGKGQYSKMHFI